MEFRKKGVFLDQAKEPALSRPIAHYVFPKMVYLRLPQRAVFQRGDQVRIDEPAFTVGNQAVFSPIDAEVEDILTPSFDNEHTYAVLRNTVTPTQRQIMKKNDEETVEPERIIAYAKKCSVVDDLDGEFLYRKLEQAQDKRKLVVVGNAIDDQPMISNHMGPLFKLTAEAAGGLRLAKKALGAAEICFAIYGEIGSSDQRIPKELEKIPVVRMKGHYPARPRLEQAIGKKYPGMRVVSISSNALIHLYRAVVYEKPHSSLFLTVAGDAIANPGNVEVALGTPVGEVLRFCGLAREPRRLITRGTMAGYRLTDTQTPVSFGMNCLIADAKDGRRTHYECIGCGRCVKACPAGINPYLAYRYITGKNQRYQQLGLERCTKCGLCSYICPSNIDVASYIQTVLGEDLPQKGEESV